VLIKYRGAGAHARFQIEACSLRNDMIAAHLLYEPIMVGARIPVRSEIMLYNVRRGFRVFFLPFAAGFMASLSFQAFY